MVQGRIYNKDSYIGTYCGAHNSGVQSLPSQASSNVHRKAAASNIKSLYHWTIDFPNQKTKGKKEKKTKPEEAHIWWNKYFWIRDGEVILIESF